MRRIVCWLYSVNQVIDLSRMCRLFYKIPRGLDPVSNIFKQVCEIEHGIFCSWKCLKQFSLICHLCSLQLSDVMFWMQHVTSEGTDLVKQAEDAAGAASSKKVYIIFILLLVKMPSAMFPWVNIFQERLVSKMQQTLCSAL